MLKNSCYMLLSSLLRLLTQVLLFVILARAWGAEQFGVFMYPLTITALLVILVDYGFTLQLVRDVGKSPERVNWVVSQAFRTKVALSIPVVLGVSVLTALVHKGPGFTALVLTLLLAAIFNSFGVLFNLPFRALGRFDEETKVVLWSNAVHFSLVMAIVWKGGGPVAVGAGFLVARLFYFIMAYLAYRRVTGCAHFEPVDRKSLIMTLRSGIPFAVHVALGTLYFQVDTLMIEHFMGARGVGTYQAGLRIIMGGLVLTDVLSNVYLPRLAQVSNLRASLVATGTQMTRHLVVPGALGLAILVVFAQPITRMLYGAAFSDVSRLLPLMAIVLFLRYFCISYATILTAADRQGIRAAGASGAVVLSVALNLILIPRYGLLGAVYASIVTHTFLGCVYMTFAWMQTRSLLIDPRTLAVLGVAALAGSLGFVASHGSPEMRAGAVAIIAFIIAFCGVARSEWRSLWRRMAGA